MSIRRDRRPHWTIVGICLGIVALTTTAAVLHEPAKHSAAGAAAPSDSASGAAGNAAARPSASSSNGTSTGSDTAGGGARPLGFGIAYGDTLLGESTAQMDAGLNDAVSVGAKWVRVDLPWSTIQPDDSSDYSWHGFDAIVSAAKARGLHVDAVLVNVPAWARASSCVGYFACPPADPEQFAHFAATAATRYASDGVDTWEIWNEPNIGSWEPAPNPTAYTTLLIDTSKALHAAEPDAYVILGGLAAVPTDAAKKYVSPYDFLTKVAALGGTKYVNAVGYHPYSLPVMPSKAPNFEAVSTSAQNLVSVLERYGTPNVSVWLTETGAPVLAAAQDPTGTQAGTKQQEAIQASYATDLVSTVAANPHVGADFWYADQDDPKNGLYFGLRRANGSYRPAFYALKDAITECACQN